MDEAKRSTNGHFIHRYVWVYLCWNTKEGEGELTTFVSKDIYGPHLDTISTPFTYQAVRNDIRYILRSEVPLNAKTVIMICGTMYDTEFIVPKTIARKRNRK